VPEADATVAPPVLMLPAAATPTRAVRLMRPSARARYAKHVASRVFEAFFFCRRRTMPHHAFIDIPAARAIRAASAICRVVSRPRHV